MRTHSMFRKSLVATGMMIAFAAVPLGQAMAQDSGSMSHDQSMSSNRTVPDKAADAWITTKVKSEFGTTTGVDMTDISVKTTDGVDMLTSTAASRTEKRHAVRVAKAVKGVKSVNVTGLKVSAMKSDHMKSDHMKSDSMKSDSMNNGH